jgi:hypothetical protein
MQVIKEPTGITLTTFPTEETFDKDVAALNMLPASAVQDTRAVVTEKGSETGTRAIKKVAFSSGATGSFVKVETLPISKFERQLGAEQIVLLDGQRYTANLIRRVFVNLVNREGK